MSTLSETLTFGLILILLVGSVCLYLYTRIQQVEQKMSLIESILLELKMTSEFKNYPVIGENVEEDVVNNSSMADFEQTGDDGISIKQHEKQEHDMQPSYTPLQDDDLGTGQTSENEGAVGLLALSEVPQTVVSDEKSGNNGVTEPSLPSYSYAPMPAEEVKQTSVPLVSVNYESMTLKELKSIAEQRNLTGISGMKRSHLIGLLNNNSIKE